MTLARTLLFGFPLLLAALAGWSVRESGRSHGQDKDSLLIMLPQPVPALNPFLPATEAERQITDLLHAPLLRLDDKGALQPALADLWRWSQDVTCWFADEAAAKRAQELLQAQIGETNRWAEWHLQSAQVRGSILLLSFSEAASDGVRQALEVLGEPAPQPVAFWRLERASALRQEMERFMATAPEAKQVHRVWFDGANACEFIVTGPAQRVLDALRGSLGTADSRSLQLNLVGEAGALVEPVLDLDIRPGRTWHDGTLVTAEDARATLEFLRTREWPLSVHEVLRQIQSLESRNDGAQLHITFRRRYGPALASLTDLPMLPAAWLRAHPQATEQDFLSQAPPGAGTHRVTARDERLLLLAPVQAQAEGSRLLFQFGATPMMTQIARSTQTVDLVWPASATDQVALSQMRFTPPRQRLVVLWNTRHAVLKRTRFREALGLAVDAAALIHSMPGRLGQADGSVFAPGLWYSTRAARPMFDLERGKQILFEEGWPQDVQGVARSASETFRFTLLVPAGDALRSRAADMLVTQWRKLGALVSLETVADAATLVQRLQQHQFDAVLLDQRFETSWDQSPWWHSAQTRFGGTNFCGIADPQVDLQLEALAAEFDPAKVAQRVRDLEARLLPLHPMLTLFTTHDEAALLSPAAKAGAGEGPWTLRALALPAKRGPAVPVINLKLRSSEDE